MAPILALGGDDRIDGRGGNDVICGGADGRSTQRNDNNIRMMVDDPGARS